MVISDIHYLVESAVADNKIKNLATKAKYFNKAVTTLKKKKRKVEHDIGEKIAQKYVNKKNSIVL